MLAELPAMIVLLIEAAVTLPVTWIPPATAWEPLFAATLFGSAADSAELLPATVLPFIVNVPPPRNIPPPSAKRPFGALALASLPLIVELVIVRAPSWLLMPPPSASLAIVDNPDAEPMRLLLTVEFMSVSVPQLSIPPPNAPAYGQGTLPGHGGPI